MSNLTLSLDGAFYSSDQKIDIWHTINFFNECPECSSKDSFLLGPMGGLAFNIKCQTCLTVFFITPFIKIGAYPTSRG